MMSNIKIDAKQSIHRAVKYIRLLIQIHSFFINITKIIIFKEIGGSYNLLQIMYSTTSSPRQRIRLFFNSFLLSAIQYLTKYSRIYWHIAMQNLHHVHTYIHTYIHSKFVVKSNSINYILWLRINQWKDWRSWMSVLLQKSSNFEFCRKD